MGVGKPGHLLITDLIMPDMNGVELIQKVKQQHPDAVAIVITAYATIKTCVDAMRYGASDYITKPFDMDEIRAVVKRAVSRAAETQAAVARHQQSFRQKPRLRCWQTPSARRCRRYCTTRSAAPPLPARRC